MSFRSLLVVMIVCGTMVTPSLAQDKKTGRSESSSPQRAAGQSTTNDPAAVQLLQQIEQVHGNVRSAVGTFSQQRIDASFGADEKNSTARFALLKPNNFKVEYVTPKPSVSLMTRDTGYYYVPEQKQVQKRKFRKAATIQDVNYLLLGFGAPTQELLSVYYVQKGNTKNSVKLVPRDTRSAQFKYITMEVTEDLLPKKFTMEQTEGSKMIVSIDTAGLQIGAPISERDFRPNWPAGTNEVDMD